MPFIIAIIGRPNVGKSTLFNRLVGQKLALVDDEPGVTRDRREGQARLGDLDFTVIDTAGLDEGPRGSLTARMQEQTETAIAAADALMFVFDARAGLLRPIVRLPISRGAPTSRSCSSPTRAKASTARLERWNPTRSGLAIPSGYPPSTAKA